MPIMDVDPSKILLGVGSVPPIAGWSRILLGVRSIPLTTGRSISRFFSEGFLLWIGFGPPACYRFFTIFSWKLGIVAVSDSAFNLGIT